MDDRHLDGDELSAFGRFEGEPRRRALRHLTACVTCRSALAGEDPSRIFSLLGRAPVPPEILDQVSRGVAAGIADRAGRRGAGGVTVARLRLAGALAASLLLAALLGLPLLGPSSPGPEVVAEAGPSAAPRAAIELVERADRAEVFDLTVGGTQVVMIFDEGMEL